MRIVFAFRHTGYLRNFESMLCSLLERGHSIHLVFSKEDKLGTSPILDKLLQNWQTASSSMLPDLKTENWYYLNKNILFLIDYLRYLHPRYENASKLRARGAKRVNPFIRWLCEFPPLKTPTGIKTLTELLKLIEKAIPRSKQIDELIQAKDPDIILVTPLIEPGSDQWGYIRSGKALAIKTGLCVASWDNLTNKGLVRLVPDIVTVWNEAQKQEAIELHYIQPEKITVTGASCYDHWFNWQPSTSREDFCQRVGLEAEKPFILYLCSSSFIAPKEVKFIKKWIQQIRSSALALNDVGILIRPHPQNTKQWQEVDFAELKNITIFPKGGANPVDIDSRAIYYDSIYYSKAVVGINTSAQIESAIIGRPVCTILAPEFSDTQEGTLHFNHLVNGGFLYIAKDFDEHLSQLSQALSIDQSSSETSQSFVESFIRPHGLEVPCTPIFVDTIEKLATQTANEPEKAPLWIYPLRIFLYPLAIFLKIINTARIIQIINRKGLKGILKDLSKRKTFAKPLLKMIKSKQG